MVIMTPLDMAKHVALVWALGVIRSNCLDMKVDMEDTEDFKDHLGKAEIMKTEPVTG